MTLTTILLDLDDTLLESNMRQFIPAYLDKLSQALVPFAPLETLPSLIRRATEALRTNQDPTVTNAQAFNEAFLPHLDGSPAEIHRTVAFFLQEIYPSLRKYVTPRPEAKPLVEYLMRQGYKVVIATNPFFYRAAIEQRLDWAGVLGFPYQLITHLENSHFCKPSLNYYREVLALVNSCPTETLMVGDDPKNDIAPAQALGCATWWITNFADAEIANSVTADYRGTLAEFYTWVRDGQSAKEPKTKE